MKTVEEVLESLEAIVVLLEEKAIRSTTYDGVVETALQLKNELEDIISNSDE